MSRCNPICRLRPLDAVLSSAVHYTGVGWMFTMVQPACRCPPWVKCRPAYEWILCAGPWVESSPWFYPAHGPRSSGHWTSPGGTRGPQSSGTPQSSSVLSLGSPQSSVLSPQSSVLSPQFSVLSPQSSVLSFKSQLPILVFIPNS